MSWTLARCNHGSSWAGLLRVKSYPGLQAACVRAGRERHENKYETVHQRSVGHIDRLSVSVITYLW